MTNRQQLECQENMGWFGKSLAVIRSWRPDSYIAKDIIGMILLWVQLHDIPIELWGYEAIYWISTIGDPISTRNCKNGYIPSYDVCHNKPRFRLSSITEIKNKCGKRDSQIKCHTWWGCQIVAIIMDLIIGGPYAKGNSSHRLGEITYQAH